MYHSNESKIYQTSPQLKTFSTFAPKGWTESLDGYLREAKKLTVCLIRNSIIQKTPYHWFVTIYTNVPVSESNNWWNKAKRNLSRKGIKAIWVREPTKTNKIHYHLLISSTHSRKSLEDIIETCLPLRSLYRWHKGIRRIVRNQFIVLHYITKARLAGWTSEGKHNEDRYASKRLLFKPGLKLRKHGTIGAFWAQPKSAIWEDVKRTQKKIEEGLRNPDIKTICESIYLLLNKTVSQKAINRSYASDWDSKNVQAIAKTFH